MNKMDFENKITQYIDGELSPKDCIMFEEAMNNNKSLKTVFDEVVHTDKLLRDLPQIKASPNFMLNLNKKIDEYNNEKNNTWYKFLQDFIINIKPAPAFSVVCIALITCFSVIKISGYNLFPNFMNSNQEYSVDLNNYIAVNDSDSLTSNNDSLNTPTLLIGNDR